RSAFIPIKATGMASLTKVFSISTASMMISRIISLDSLFLMWSLYNKQAKSQCIPSSLEINSLEKVNPGIIPLFFNQKIEQNEPEKNMNYTAAIAISLSYK